jgi:hypothetical protein
MRLAALAQYFGLDGWGLLEEDDPARLAARAALVQGVADLHAEAAAAMKRGAQTKSKG